MHRLIILLALMASLSVASAATAPRQPVRSGQYIFRLKFAEHPDMPSSWVTVKIRGRRIQVISGARTADFPNEVIAEGIIMWHPESEQWIIGQHKKDRYASEVGGCTDGPEVIDLQNRIYWTC